MLLHQAAVLLPQNRSHPSLESMTEICFAVKRKYAYTKHDNMYQIPHKHDMTDWLLDNDDDDEEVEEEEQRIIGPYPEHLLVLDQMLILFPSSLDTILHNLDMIRLFAMLHVPPLPLL
jgi:hypothetical protein